MLLGVASLLFLFQSCDVNISCDVNFGTTATSKMFLSFTSMKMEQKFSRFMLSCDEDYRFLYERY